MRSSLVRLRWCGLAVLLGATPAFSQQIAPPFADEARGMALYTTGAQRVEDGDWAGAANALEAAWALTRRAEVLPQLARAYEGMGDLARAADTWTSYRDRAPLAERDVISARIASLRVVAPSVGGAAPIPAAAVEPRARPRAATPWVLAGLGGGLAAVGFTVAATGEGPRWDSAHPLDRVGVGTAVAGASVSLTGVAWAVGRAFGRSDQPALTVTDSAAVRDPAE